jgi:hypothetical protein
MQSSPGRSELAAWWLAKPCLGQMAAPSDGLNSNPRLHDLTTNEKRLSAMNPAPASGPGTNDSNAVKPLEFASQPLREEPPVRLKGPSSSSLRVKPHAAAKWPLAKRVGFRLLLLYFGLFAFPFPLDSVPWLGSYVHESVNRLWSLAARWIGASLLGIRREMVVDLTGSGDRTVDYLALLISVVLALAATGVWSLLDWGRLHYRFAARWLEVAVRYLLGLTMLRYGILKLIPVQFLAPSLGRLLQPYGDSSPMGLLWTFMGASTAYTIFAGLAEVIGAGLVLLRRTRALGALVLTAVLTNVSVLNFAYDVPVKLFSIHLLLMALGLLALDGRRLAAVFLRNEATPPAEHWPLFRQRRWNLTGRVFGILLIGSVTWTTASRAWSAYSTWGGGRELPELWGIYDVESFRSDGREFPPLTTDEVRWKALLVDRALPVRLDGGETPGWITVQHMDGSLTQHSVELDEAIRTLTRLSEDQPSKKRARGAGAEVKDILHYDQSDAGHLVLRGRWQGAQIEIHLRKRDLTSMELTGRGYHWISEVPFNR